MWKNTFHNGPTLDFSEEDCPMLIGIHKTEDYQIIPLMKTDTLIRRKKKFDLGLVLRELTLFREEFDTLVNEYNKHFVAIDLLFILVRRIFSRKSLSERSAARNLRVSVIK